MITMIGLTNNANTNSKNPQDNDLNIGFYWGAFGANPRILLGTNKQNGDHDRYGSQALGGERDVTHNAGEIRVPVQIE